MKYYQTKFYNTKITWYLCVTHTLLPYIRRIMGQNGHD